MRPILVLLAASTALSAADVTEIRRQFADPPPAARPMMRWWWFGPSVTKEGIEREMRLMKEGGIGGFEVQPVYPLALDDPSRKFRNLPFLSAEFLDALRFTEEKSRELGLRMELTLGSGWPYGGPQIPVTQASGRLRIDKVKVQSARVPLPDLSHGEKLIAAFAGGTQRELTDMRDGALWLPAGPERPAEVWFFISGRTGMMVKRPSAGAEGFVLDHYDRGAIDNYLANVGEPMLKAFNGKLPKAIFCDSLEVFGSDWTPDFLEQFQKRRGYDLRPYLPALAADTGPHTAGIRHDWGKTLTELLDERFLAPMREFSRKHGTEFRIQGYGIPPAVISSYRYADIPEGEGFQWKVLRASRWASSASHLLGRPIATSETWTWLHSPSFRATPLDMKAEADLHFLQGINQLIGHGWPYTPEGAEYPGWRFYAAAVFSHSNPWWIAMPDISRYLQRVSYLMREGRAANDVAVYLPNSDAWSHFSAGRVHMIEVLREHVGNELIPQIIDSGYGLDFFDDGTADAALDPKRYRVVVMPRVETLPVETARKLEAYVKSGGTVLATGRTPSRAPGFKATDSDHAEIAKRVTGFKLIAADRQLGEALKGVLTPDLAITPAQSDIGFIHRSAEPADIYFVANTGNTRKTVKAAFRMDGKNPELWDPMTGKTQPAQVLERGKGTTTVALDLQPYESRVVVFGTQAAARPATRVAAGNPIDIGKGWTVTFAKGQAGKLDAPASWTADERTRYFSGVATYQKTVQVPADLLRAGNEVKLDFGEGTALKEVERRNGMRAWIDGPVREAAVVYVNGKRAGAVWAPPYSVDVTSLLKAGENAIRIEVGNLAINHLAGSQLPSYRLLNLRYGVRFEPQDMNRLEPLPSGLLGPIRLIAENVK